MKKTTPAKPVLLAMTRSLASSVSTQPGTLPDEVSGFVSRLPVGLADLEASASIASSFDSSYGRPGVVAERLSSRST